MKKALLVILFTISTSLYAQTAEYLVRLPTTYQEVNFTVEALKTYLSPIGYQLVPESVDISDSIAVGGPREIYLRTDEYSTKQVSFLATEKNSKKTYGGSIFLIVADKEIAAKLKLENLNSSAKKLQTSSFYTKEDFILLLARGYGDSTFSTDITPLDFKLQLKK